MTDQSAVEEQLRARFGIVEQDRMLGLPWHGPRWVRPGELMRSHGHRVVAEGDLCDDLPQ